MSYKTILVHIDSTKRCSARIDTASRLAREYDAHLIALYVTPLFEPSGYVLAEMGPALIETRKHALAAQMSRSEAEFAERAAAAGVTNIEWRTAIDDPVDAMVLHSRYADLLVIGQADTSGGSIMDTGFPPQLVLASGRPVLILPSTGQFSTIGKRALVAWNASREATRAVTDAIPLLQSAQKVQVIAVNPKRNEHGSVPGADIGLYLARHGVRVEVKMDQGAEIDVGNELLSRAADFDADLIVMGGYGHSRLKEWVLGGVTRTILESMTAPVLMSH